ncbi:hypothetical protein KKF91_05970 [Myxococcota bacterium]|nr:hypothetical protein [Myxococcota bacterium]MBU1430098.1 hypothetical protein [Myxococcota bacterium]MBU1896844.1 hypothetical protein [Myxococcota bacterium]
MLSYFEGVEINIEFEQDPFERGDGPPPSEAMIHLSVLIKRVHFALSCFDVELSELELFGRLGLIAPPPGGDTVTSRPATWGGSSWGPLRRTTGRALTGVSA